MTGEQPPWQRPPRRYFPVDWAGAGDSYPLGPDSPAGQDLLEFDRELPRYQSAKRDVARLPERGPLSSDMPGLAAARAAAETLLREHMRRARLPRHALQGDLDELVFQLQEDLVLMLRRRTWPAERARASYLHVSFPSGWDPARMLGKSFLALHARVPDEEAFARDTRAHLAQQLFDGVRGRFVWGVSADGDLDHHPAQPRPGWEGAHEGHLRVERQLMVPLAVADPDTHAAMFLIRVYVVPFSDLAREQRVRLTHALHALSPVLQRYKGVAGHLSLLARLLA